jgi:hypothetical protein
LSGLIAVTEAHFKRPTIEQLSLIAVTKEPSKLVALGNWCLGACLHASVSPRFCELIRWSRAEKPPSSHWNLPLSFLSGFETLRVGSTPEKNNKHPGSCFPISQQPSFLFVVFLSFFWQ